MIHVQNLSKKIQDKQILKNISFSLDKGDVLGLVGANGAGKSTLMRIIAGILPAKQGTVEYRIADQKILLSKTSIAYISQEIVLYEDMSVLENLTLFGSGKTDPSSLAEQIRTLSESLSLEAYLHQKVGSLSGGLKRRVHIAAGLTGSIRLALMDEPIVGIDRGKTKDVQELIHDLQAQGCTIVLSSHTSDFLQNTCNKLLMLHEGQQTYFGPLDIRFFDALGESHE